MSSSSCRRCQWDINTDIFNSGFNKPSCVNSRQCAIKPTAVGVWCIGGYPHATCVGTHSRLHSCGCAYPAVMRMHVAARRGGPIPAKRRSPSEPGHGPHPDPQSNKGLFRIRELAVRILVLARTHMRMPMHLTQLRLLRILGQSLQHPRCHTATRLWICCAGSSIAFEFCDMHSHKPQAR